MKKFGLITALGTCVLMMALSALAPAFAAMEVDCDIEKANSYDDAWELGPKGWVVTMQKRHEGFVGASGALLINGDSNLDRGPGWMWMNISPSADYPKDGNGSPMPKGYMRQDQGRSS